MIRILFFLLLLSLSPLSFAMTVHAKEPQRDHADIGICADMHRMKKEAGSGFSPYRGALIDEGLSPYDSPQSGYMKKRYTPTKNIIHNASQCEIWIPENPEVYQNARYICHWDAAHADDRKKTFDYIHDILQTCFNYGEFICVDVYGPRKICFVKNTQKGDTAIEWGEGISKDDQDRSKYFSYFTIFEKTTK